MTNKELFLTFFEVESATIIGVKYRDNEKLQLILIPTDKNKFMDKLPIRLLTEVKEFYTSSLATTNEVVFNLFKYLGLNASDIMKICREIHNDFGSKKLIVPY
jgi:hypothetical protein